MPNDYSEMTDDELLERFKATQPYAGESLGRDVPTWPPEDMAENLAVTRELRDRGWTLKPSRWIPPE